MPDLQIVDCVATVAPLYMQARPAGATRAGTSLPPMQASARLLHAPSSHLYWVSDWQLAEPGEYLFPFSSQPLPATGRFSAQAVPHPFHCPSSHRYWVPD